MDFFGLDLVELIKTVGYIGIFAVIFAESGLLFGMFFPGDSLLFTSGFLASTGVLNFPVLTAGSFIAAVLGDNVGYAFGKKVGPLIFKKEESFWFNKRHLERANKFYQKHGGKTIILARFLPIVRTFAPILAGVGVMEYRTFFLFNILGALIWAVGVTGLGYFLGSFIPDVDKYLIPIVLLIIILSILPAATHFLKEFLRSKARRASLDS